MLKYDGDSIMVTAAQLDKRRKIRFDYMAGSWLLRQVG